ncbi:polyprenyl synthetase family protein [Sedimentibacter sp. zth1]|uniref:polyprenyl synthetase family protein n=1 Tax=Sedimentibacter sp. zth1 TaxID=2816908 RepID=UPI001A9347FD|nr:farnesyl diphosphate synthase [Sedimentibacter sp. zth1]QSX04737.1 polyprenyl synthetase family protein [Sedimentibacter sp. zth1]
MNFNLWLNNKVESVEQALKENCTNNENLQKIIYEAMGYSLFAGGKRLRPIIMLGVNEMLSGDSEQVLPFACAMEMIHTYSLIHDDLPAMDNDDYRRGRLSNHKKFGETTAILAGDGLLNMAFEVMSRYSLNSDIDKEIALKAIYTIANSAGTEGMIGGQVVDMFCEDSIKDVNGLEYLQRYKTGAIIRSSAVVGGILGGASKEELEKIEMFADKLGLAFQIQDDILDVEGDEAKLGKPIGSDDENNKKTYVTMIGLEKSKQMQHKLTNEAIDALSCFGERNKMLVELCKYLLDREK